MYRVLLRFDPDAGVTVTESLEQPKRVEAIANEIRRMNPLALLRDIERRLLDTQGPSTELVRELTAAQMLYREITDIYALVVSALSGERAVRISRQPVNQALLARHLDRLRVMLLAHRDFATILQRNETSLAQQWRDSPVFATLSTEARAQYDEIEAEERSLTLTLRLVSDAVERIESEVLFPPPPDAAKLVERA